MEEILNGLFALKDEKYAEFQSKLMPETDRKRIIGVRVPLLRQFAKKIFALNNYEAFLKELPHTYYEENCLHGFLIEQCKDFERCVLLLNEFLPFVDNWATCDMTNPKILRKNRDKLYSPIEKWINSPNKFEVRFGIKCIMDNFLDEDFSSEYLGKVANIRSDGYYVKMMQAWFFATALAKKYEETEKIFKECLLDGWVHNKALQKAVESRRISGERKEYLKTLKIPLHVKER